MFQRPRMITFAVLMAMGLFSLNPASGAILAKYVFTSGSTASAGDSGLADPQNFVNNGNTSDINFSGSSHNAFFRSQGTAADQAGALADSDFYTVTINAVGSRLLNLDSIEFDFGASNGGLDSTVETFVYLQSDVDGTGAGNPVIFSDSKTTGFTDGGAGSLTGTGPIDLTDAKFQLLNSITFRFSFSDDKDNFADHIARLDNVVVNGTVVPTPAALPAGLAMFGMLSLRRRR